MNESCDIRLLGGGVHHCATCDARWDTDNDEASPCDTGALLPFGVAGLVGASVVGAALICLGVAGLLWSLDRAARTVLVVLGGL